MSTTLSQTSSALNQELQALRGNWMSLEPDARAALQTRLKIVQAWTAIAQLRSVEGTALADLLASPEVAWLKDQLPSQ